MTSLVQFYAHFYGYEFARYFTRPSDIKRKNFKVQFTVENPKNLYLHLHRNNGYHHCLISNYDHRRKDNLKQPDHRFMYFDRVFFDFDISHKKISNIKNILKNLRAKGLNNSKFLQDKLRNKIRDLIIDERIVEPAINEAKNFSNKFSEVYGKDLALFFSGCKGAHAYAFFEPTRFKNFNQTIHWLGNHIKKSFKYDTMDLKVFDKPSSRKTRIPYSKHPYTHLSVVPFTLDDEYDTIMEKALKPQVEFFQVEDYLTNFNSYLLKIDEIESKNAEIEINGPKFSRKGIDLGVGNTIDHVEWFKKVLGPPERKTSRYVQYVCPFPDHNDTDPSFTVYKNGYYCFGCGKKGNSWQFLKYFNQK